MTATDGRFGLQVDGLVDLQRWLRRIDTALPKRLRVVHRQVAELVARTGRANAARLGAMERRAADAGLRARGEQRGAYVVLRASARAPWAMGAEFGANQNTLRIRRTGRYVGYRQFVPWTGNGTDAGRFFYPAVRSEGRKVVSEYLELLDELLATASEGPSL